MKTKRAKQNEDISLKDRKKFTLTFLRSERKSGNITSDYPIVSQHLCREIGLPTNAGTMLRKIVHSLRSDGYPIGSNSRGYFYARTRKEIEPTIKQLREREVEIRYARMGLQKH